MARFRKSMNLAIFTVMVGFFVGCDTPQESAYPTVDRLTAGIFLEPETRFALRSGISVRKVYAPGIELTKLSEGFRARLYNDAANYCTIAYGHLVKLAACDGTEPEEFRNGVTRARGTDILRADMENAERAVMALTDVELTDGQYAALCDFVYNVGSGNFGSSTLRKVVNAAQFDRVPSQFRRWVFAGKKELPGLKVRREKEIELFFEGVAVPRALPRAEEDLTPIDIRVGETT